MLIYCRVFAKNHVRKISSSLTIQCICHRQGTKFGGETIQVSSCEPTPFHSYQEGVSYLQRPNRRHKCDIVGQAIAQAIKGWIGFVRQHPSQGN